MKQAELLDYLRALVTEVCIPYRALRQTRAILLIGSVAYGIVDQYSDIDLALYYEELPSDQELRQAMRQNRCEATDWVLGSRESGGLIESYRVQDVECQLAHMTLASWEQSMDSILVDLDVDSPIQKACSGVLAGIPICGGELIEKFRARLSIYPRDLGIAMVKKHLAFQPLWTYEERLKNRDGLLWRQQVLVEGSHNMLGILAGINSLYFSTFQFKRMGAFVNEMQAKPDRLEQRIDSLFKNSETSIQVYRGLVADVIDLIDTYMPEVETKTIHERLAKIEHRWKPNFND